jgi:protein-S-isoprenylcysteine O-methyltransferase Ste14
MQEKLKRDWAPIAFFGVIVATKTYYLVVNLISEERLWGLLGNIGSIENYGPGATYYLTSQLSYVLYYFTALAFDALVFYSFIVRVGAKERPKGFWENAYPLFTVFVPVIGFTLLFIPEVRNLMPRYSEGILKMLLDISPLFPFYLYLTGTVIGLLGAAFSIWALSYLKRSFGLRAAVRELVSTGPYKRVRHPLYLGEIVHILGIAILSGTPVGLYLFVVAVALQIVRAKIEERKFLRTLPEYRTYWESTGFLWPRLRHPR